MSFAFSNPYQAIPPAPFSDLIACFSFEQPAGVNSYQIWIANPGGQQRIRLFNIVFMGRESGVVVVNVWESVTMAVDGSGLGRRIFTAPISGSLGTPMPVVYPSNGFPCTPGNGLILQINNISAGPVFVHWTAPYAVE